MLHEKYFFASPINEYPSANKGQKDIKVSAAYWLKDNKVMVLERAKGLVRFHEVRSIYAGVRVCVCALACMHAHTRHMQTHPRVFRSTSTPETTSSLSSTRRYTSPSTPSSLRSATWRARPCAVTQCAPTHAALRARATQHRSAFARSRAKTRMATRRTIAIARRSSAPWCLPPVSAPDHAMRDCSCLWVSHCRPPYHHPESPLATPCGVAGACCNCH